MDGRQDRIIIIETFRLGTATRCVGRIKGQLGQEPLSALVASGDLLQLGDVSGAEMSIIVQPVEVRLVPVPNESKFAWPGRLHLNIHRQRWPRISAVAKYDRDCGAVAYSKPAEIRQQEPKTAARRTAAGQFRRKCALLPGSLKQACPIEAEQ